MIAARIKKYVIRKHYSWQKYIYRSSKDWDYNPNRDSTLGCNHTNSVVQHAILKMMYREDYE